jgi:hypothetical protein
MKQLTEDLFAVDVPENTRILKDVMNIDGTIPEGFEIIGTVTADEIDFDVEPFLEIIYQNGTLFYLNYERKEMFINEPKHLASQSFRSLLTSKGIHFVNPYGELQYCCSGSDCGCMGFPINFSCKEEYEEYQTIENALVKKIVIIQKVK